MKHERNALLKEGRLLNGAFGASTSYRQKQPDKENEEVEEGIECHCNTAFRKKYDVLSYVPAYLYMNLYMHTCIYVLSHNACRHSGSSFSETIY